MVDIKGFSAVLALRGGFGTPAGRGGRTQSDELYEILGLFFLRFDIFASKNVRRPSFLILPEFCRTG